MRNLSAVLIGRVRRLLVCAAAVTAAILLYASAGAATAPAATVTITQGPPYWTAATDASFRFSTMDPLECRLDAHRDTLAGWAPCADPYTVTGPLADGRHVLEVRPTGDPAAADSWVWRVDVAPPTIPAVLEPETFWQRDRNTTVSWSATDDYSGVGDYTLRYDEWTSDGVAYLAVPWMTATKATGATFVARPGRTYCFEATARDRARNAAFGWSPRRCFALPLDDRAFERRGRWVRQADAPDYFFDTYVETVQRGASLRRQVVAKRIALLVTKCRGCGSVAVRWRGKVVREIALGAARTRPSTLVAVVTLPAAERGMLRVDVTSSTGRPVRIDGLAVSAL
jgi:hypothetical protein